MKRIILCVLAALLFLPVMAGKTEKKWQFALNDEGECVVCANIPTRLQAEAAMKAVKKAINKQTFEQRSVLDDQAGVSVQYDLTKNTKMRINPFAGNFYESMRFVLKATYAEGMVQFILTDWILINRYDGFTKTISQDSFSGRIASYEEAENGLKAGVYKGKDKKAAQSTMEETSDSLNQCQLELDKIFEVIQKELGSIQ